MATLVGTQKRLVDALDALLELDYDAIEAYRVAVERVVDAEHRAELRSFMADHERHVTVLRLLITRLGAEPARGPDVKQWLTKGKVVVMGLAGDDALLLAMKTNEDDTTTAYERVLARDDLTADVRVVLEKNVADERRHREWLEGRLARGRHAHAG